MQRVRLDGTLVLYIVREQGPQISQKGSNFSGQAGNDLFCSLDTIESFSGKIKFYSLELSAESKMAAGGHIGKMKYLRITNDTIFNGFLGSRNQIKMFVW